MSLKLIFLLALLGTPVVVKFLEQKSQFVKTFGAIVFCYILGVLIGMVEGTALDSVHIKDITEMSLLLAIPLLLLNSTPNQILQQTPQLLKAFFLSLVTVSISVLLIGFAFRAHIKDLPIILASIEAIFTGGSANLSSLYLALEMSDQLFTQIFTCDFLTGALYFLIALRICQNAVHPDLCKIEEGPVQAMFQKKSTKFLLYSLAMVAASLGLSFAFFQALNGTFIIIFLTTISILGAYFTKFKDSSVGENLGEYFLLLFCLLLGLQIDLSSLSEGLSTIALIFLSVLALNCVIYYLVCRKLKFPFAESFIAHVASIFGPPFVIVMSRNMKRQDLLVPGIALGSIGIALGTFLGIFVHRLLLH